MDPRHFYVVSAQKPTVVHTAVKCNFTAPDEMNLVVAKGHMLEVFMVTADGLSSLFEMSLFGTVATLVAFKPPVCVFLSLLPVFFIIYFIFYFSSEQSSRYRGVNADDRPK
jgi:hypothetical protein